MFLNETICDLSIVCLNTHIMKMLGGKLMVLDVAALM